MITLQPTAAGHGRPGAPRSARRTALALLLLALLVAAPAPGVEAPPPDEYQVKAAFVVGFARFVEWPAEAFGAPHAPIVVGVAGAGAFGGDLERAAAGRGAQGRPFVVKRFERVGELEPCHILFVHRGEDPRRWLSALRERQGSGTLTVGEGDEFGRHGVIALVIEDRRIRLAVNLEAASAARLKISSKLLALARIVSGSRAGL
jgi:hypothetical protein